MLKMDCLQIQLEMNWMTYLVETLYNQLKSHMVLMVTICIYCVP